MLNFENNNNEVIICLPPFYIWDACHHAQFGLNYVYKCGFKYDHLYVIFQYLLQPNDVDLERLRSELEEGLSQLTVCKPGDLQEVSIL